MKVQLIVQGIEVKGNKVHISAKDCTGTLELPNEGSIAKNPPAAGSTIEVTLSAENYESLQGNQGQVSGRFHGVIQPAAESGGKPRSSDFGSGG